MGYVRSRARCVPLQYPSSATRGVKKALSLNKQAINQNLSVISTPLQEKKSDETLNLLSEKFTDQVSQSESGMFYELSNKNKMECEKYQDCSWFQQSPIKSDCNSKLSLAETVDSFTETDEFDWSMQYANAQTSPWGDEYLEVFTDDILLENNYNKWGEKNKNFITNEDFYDSYKADEDNAFDSYNINFSLKKTDSVDSMKNISSTNPAEVIPISYKEKLNYSNYGLTKLNEVKSEIKKEVELYSPESGSYVMDSDDSELNIGREEVIEEMNHAEDHENNEKEPIINKSNQIKLEISNNTTPSDYVVNEKINQAKNTRLDTISLKTENGALNQAVRGKLDLNLDISKLNFEQSMDVNTPDLDFMDLVDFINEEMRQENNNITTLNSTRNDNIKLTSETDQHSISNENQITEDNVEPVSEKLEHSSTVQNQSFVDNFVSTDVNGNGTIDLKDLSNPGVSIAERIKTSAKRRTRKSMKDFIQTEDEESCESWDEDDDDDDVDYDFREDVAKRKCAPINKRTKSNYSDSSGDGKRVREESSSYRERRDKNNEASRRSRQNRKARERHMYETLEEEERRNVKLKAEADVLEKQVTSLRQLLLQVVLRKGGTT